MQQAIAAAMAALKGLGGGGQGGGVSTSLPPEQGGGGSTGPFGATSPEDVSCIPLDGDVVNGVTNCPDDDCNNCVLDYSVQRDFSESANGVTIQG